jgi:hypothetical protein
MVYVNFFTIKQGMNKYKKKWVLGFFMSMAGLNLWGGAKLGSF